MTQRIAGIVTLGIGLAAAAHAQSASVAIDPSSQFGTRGGQVTVAVKVTTSGALVGGCQGRLQYLSSALDFRADLSTANANTWGFFHTITEPSADTLSFGVYVNPGQSVSGADVLIATLVFDVLPDAGLFSLLDLLETTSPPGFEVLCIAPDGTTPVATSAADGVVNILDPTIVSATHTPTNTPTGPPVATPTRTAVRTRTPTAVRSVSPTVAAGEDCL